MIDNNVVDNTIQAAGGGLKAIDVKERSELLYHGDPMQALKGLEAYAEDPAQSTPRMKEVLERIKPLVGDQQRRERLGLTDEVIRLLAIAAGLRLLDDQDKQYGPQRTNSLLFYYSKARSLADDELKRLAGVTSKQRVGALIVASMAWLWKQVPEDFPSKPGEPRRTKVRELDLAKLRTSRRLRGNEAISEAIGARWDDPIEQKRLTAAIRDGKAKKAEARRSSGESSDYLRV